MVVPLWARISLFNRGVGLSGIIRNEWMNKRSPYLQLRGWGKYWIKDIPEILLTVVLRRRGDWMKRRTKRQAPVCKRRFTFVPLISRITQTFWMVMVVWTIRTGERSPGTQQFYCWTIWETCSGASGQSS